MLGGCGASAASSSAAESIVSTDSAPLKVMASFYPMYDFAQKIGGDKVTVTNMVPAGIEPHDWEPSTTDITNLEDADVFIYSGAGMEHWVDSVLGSLTNQDLDVVQASDGITLREGYEDEDGDVGADPHVWLAPANAKSRDEKVSPRCCAAPTLPTLNSTGRTTSSGRWNVTGWTRNLPRHCLPCPNKNHCCLARGVRLSLRCLRSESGRH